jgi:hypothetical protein
VVIEHQRMRRRHLLVWGGFLCASRNLVRKAPKRRSFSARAQETSAIHAAGAFSNGALTSGCGPACAKTQNRAAEIVSWLEDISFKARRGRS